MATLLFYQRPVPLNADVHLNARLGTLAGDFSFSTSTNSIPLAAVEFFDTAREYPIAFTGKEGGPLFPIALIGSSHIFARWMGTWRFSRTANSGACWPHDGSDCRWTKRSIFRSAPRRSAFSATTPTTPR